MELLKLIIVLIIIGIVNIYVTDWSIDRADNIKFKEKLMEINRHNTIK
jgi:hypothetical protein